MKLHISPDLPLPIEAVTEALGFLGRRGSGKSYAAMKLAEEMHRAKAQFVALDPVGIWWGLRLAADGTSPGINLPIFGGLHGDVPLEPASGKLIADVLVDRAISAVVDVSQFESDADKARFARDFAARFFFRKKSAPSAVHLFMEEAQEFVPQNPQRDEAQMLHHFQRYIKLGRNFGLGVSLISQRPQEVNKKVLNMTELLFAFQMTGPQERKTMEGWIAEKGIDEDIAGELPKLQRGAPHAWSPAWLKVSKVVTIAEKWTYDTGATPKMQQASVQPRELSPIDVAQLGKEIVASAEKAKAEDPKALRAEIARLKRERELELKHPLERRVEKKVVDQEAIRREVGRALDDQARTISRRNAEAVRAGRQVSTALDKVGVLLTETIAPGFRLVISALEVPVPVEPNGNGAKALATIERAPRPIAASRPVARVSSAAPKEPSEGISRTQQRILDAMRAYEGLGISAPTRAMVAGYCSISHTTGSFSNNLSALRTAGYIVDRASGALALTPAGRAISHADDIPSLEELHERWYRKLSGTQANMVRQIVTAWPNPIQRSAVADSLGIQADTGSFSNNLSKLRTLGLIEDVSRTEVQATEVLFPEGLS